MRAFQSRYNENPLPTTPDDKGEEVTPQPIESGNKFPATPTMAVNANFYTKGNVWCFQSPTCQHMGTDLIGPEGTPVYLPFTGKVYYRGYYPNDPLLGYYFGFILADGYEYYSGHLKNPIDINVGDVVQAGTKLGEMNSYNHTHVQMKDTSKTLIDFEEYYARK